MHLFIIGLAVLVLAAIIICLGVAFIGLQQHDARITNTEGVNGALSRRLKEVEENIKPAKLRETLHLAVEDKPRRHRR